MEIKVCTNCHYSGKERKPGSGWIELILYLFYIIPGLLYSIWRRGFYRRNVCPSCGSKTMIPADTPKGRKILAENKADT